MNEYVTLVALKAALTISDTEVDTQLDRVRESASRQIDGFCGRRFYLDASATARTYTYSDRVCATDDGEKFFVDDMGVAPTLVEVGSAAGGWATVTDCEYSPDNALVRGRAIEALLRPSWAGAATATRVRVTARWGWPTVPPEVAEAALILASRLYKRKDSPEGVMGSTEWGAIRLSRTDPDVASLLAPYVLLGAA